MTRRRSRKRSNRKRSSRKRRSQYMPIAYKSLGISAPFGAWTMIKKSDFNRLKRQGLLHYNY